MSSVWLAPRRGSSYATALPVARRAFVAALDSEREMEADERHREMEGVIEGVGWSAFVQGALLVALLRSPAGVPCRVV
jgi:hypothetical protein